MEYTAQSPQSADRVIFLIHADDAVHGGDINWHTKFSNDQQNKQINTEMNRCEMKQ